MVVTLTGGGPDERPVTQHFTNSQFVKFLTILDYES
jgi:hypothetical protein